MNATTQVVAVTAPAAYQVTIEPGLLQQAGHWLAPYARNGRVVIVSDDNVWAALGAAFTTTLAHAGLEGVPIIVTPGEDGKSWQSLITLIDRLLEHKVERGDTLVAFGGGVVGDLTGFAAAILKRGCSFVQVPTTLLAQVDSSVGGKTGINTAAGKNLVGAFSQPSAVFIDPDCLATLPRRELLAGYAEVVKYGLIGDAGFFAWCEANGAALIAGDAGARVQAIATSVRAKAAVVAQDPLETTGQRMLLNFGHTFGHALEAETGFGPRLLHGEGVALGMAMASRLSARLGHCTPADAARTGAHLAAVGLPTRLSDVAGLDASAATLVGHMRHDKKAQGGRIPLILIRGIGAAFVDDNVGEGALLAFLDSERAA